jgi:hypothetical protein
MLVQLPNGNDGLPTDVDVLHYHGRPPGGAAAAAPEGGALACPSVLTPTSSRWAMVSL